MTVGVLLCACAVAAAPRGEPRPKRDLFGTAGQRRERRPGAPARLWGTVELSDGTRTQGWLSLTPGRPLEVYDLDAREWREFELHEIATLRAAPRREELEREWRWKEYGKDEKVYTGRAYPRRWLDHEIVLRAEDEKDGKGGERIRCHIKGAVLHLTAEPHVSAAEKAASEKTKPGERPATEIATDDTQRPATEVTENTEGERQRKARVPVGGQEEPLPSETGVTSVASGRRGDGARRRLRFILRQYERGTLGQTLDDLVYVKRVEAHERDRAPGQGAGKKRTGTRDPGRPVSGQNRTSAAK